MSGIRAVNNDGSSEILLNLFHQTHSYNSQNETSSHSLVEKLKGMISQFVKPTPLQSKPDVQLVGRIQQMKENTDVIRKLLDQVTSQAVSSRPIVSENVIQLAAESIAKDLQTVSDYQIHRFGELALDKSKKESLQGQLGRSLTTLLMNQLSDLVKSVEVDLQKHPKKVPQDKLIIWNEKITLLRQSFFNEALNIVENTIEPAAEHVDEHLMLNFKEIADLELAVPQILDEIQSLRETYGGELLDKDHKRLLERLFLLEDEAQKLESELELTPELKSRLRSMERLLFQAHGFLGYS